MNDEQRDQEAMDVLRARKDGEIAFKYHPGGASTALTMLVGPAARSALNKPYPRHFSDPADAILAHSRDG